MTPPPERPGPSPATMVSFVLLAVLALLLLAPLVLGSPPPSPFLIAGLLLVRLGVQVYRAQSDPRLKRPASWALDLLLIGLLLYVASNRPAA
ncbi:MULTISPECIES: hypothetical protein [Deinococcus]|uniref:DUF3017 domain-containing protein n=2 Tax=Deinococcus TaxID=1298 RepID=A0A221SX10_9DEIO|nr:MULTISPECIES: hypothetical protein [Deinococcus]ASN81173.1 hypothetical protein DFI_09275 [Deinococcus ficus]MDP9763223.1 4-hydroxybenzoate polyprenyltransferase [Deinococcus enclensis]GHF67779.1 hypothetical protein GCM10017782_01690 [Deinococcus ficus]